MNKKDLKDGMIVKLRNNVYNNILHGDILRRDEDKYEIIVSLIKYNDDMTFDKDKYLDIMKVYDSNMNLLWERKEIDWSKIPHDTKVLVRNSKDQTWEKRYFESYEFKKDCPFNTYIMGQTYWSSNGEHAAWRYCELVEGEYERLQKEGIL